MTKEFCDYTGPAETLIFDVLKYTWSVAVASPPSSITTNKVCPGLLTPQKKTKAHVVFSTLVSYVLLEYLSMFTSLCTVHDALLSFSYVVNNWSLISNRVTEVQ